jgi:DNA helicase-2/ATP-dependent DNA helicase PcrA
MNLSKEQQIVVNLNSGQHLVLAPPGTGKTELLVQRLSHAIKSGIDEKEMLCLTFTNRAAKNMIDRIESELGIHNIFIGNIHSFCSMFLRKHHLIPYSMSLLDEEDVKILFNQIKSPKNSNANKQSNYNKSLDDEIYLEDNTPGIKCWVHGRYKTEEIKTEELSNLNAYLKQVSLGFDSFLTIEPSIIYCSAKDKENAIKICHEYEKIKNESNFMDFDDLLTLTHHYLSTIDVTTRNKIGYKWLQIDEVQDLNPLQWAIVNLISTKESSHRVFFGDYEQSIFSFMGAKLEVLDAVAVDSIVHELQYNYRSPQYLLDLYNAYARANLAPKWMHNPISMNTSEMPINGLRYKKILSEDVNRSQQYGHSNDFFKNHSLESNENLWITQKILPREPQESTAILVRTNNLADEFAQILNKQNIKYYKISGFDLFRRAIIKDLMAFLGVIINSYDRNQWIRNINLYAKLNSLGAARIITNELFQVGILPLDFLSTNNIRISYLDDLLHNIKNQRIVVFDTETTGLDTDKDDIIQIAAIEIINGKLGNTFEVYINTQFSLTESEKIHKISKDFLNKYAIEKELAFNQFFEFIGDDLLVAHNSEYDYKIINSNLKRLTSNGHLDKQKVVDSIDIAKRLYPKLPSYKLEYLLDRLGIEGVNSHNAIDDVKATANLLMALSTKISETQHIREVVLQKYDKALMKFSSNFSPIYTAVTGYFGRELAMNNLIDIIIHYMQDQMKYKMDDNIYDEIEKLARHMRLKCLIDESLKSIKTYIPEYTKYKESDLVIGDEKLVIATIHKAKGLEFENVIIPSCTDSTFPSFFSEKDGEKAIKEDARLLYVAMTRARKRLLITSSSKESRFLTPVMHMLESKS